LIELVKEGVYLINGTAVVPERQGLTSADLQGKAPDRVAARQATLAFQILKAHNTSGAMESLKLRFDALASHDITYVGIVQTARASGLKEFPVPYVLTNCHNSLCAVGGTINEDDHVFGLSAAQKYGGIFVPAHQAVIHQYMREMHSGCGRMILGSDSHTRYGPLGTMAVGEGGPEIVKQLLSKTYDIAYPEIIAVYLENTPQAGVGPQDVALALIKAVFASGFVKNKVLEFVGPGIAGLSIDYRNGIDVMTTETTCLSSIWTTDEATAAYFKIHGRPDAYAKLEPGALAYYDGLIRIDLAKVEPMIALPFHPSNAFPIREVNQRPQEILAVVEEEAARQLENPALRFDLRSKITKGRLCLDQGVIAGCAGGTFENIYAAAVILNNKSTGPSDFWLSVYPASQPINLELTKNGAMAKLMAAGVTIRTAFCGPCFGAGDVPANGAISGRHSTRNFPNREGSKPANGQIASVALMDARSIAATAANGGLLTAATELSFSEPKPEYSFDKTVYENRVYQGFGKSQPALELKFGPNIVDWPQMSPLTENLLLQIACVIRDPVTTTDELIPSGETSSYRSNPLKLAEFTLGRKDPSYVARAKAFQRLEQARLKGGLTSPNELKAILESAAGKSLSGAELQTLLAQTGLGTVIFANKPGDGSAREQAASCQKVLGGWANIALEYATKRYRSNLINWGMLPFTVDAAVAEAFQTGDYIFVPGIRAAVESGATEVAAQLVSKGGVKPFTLKLADLSKEDREIILAGCLINYYGK
jgi:aconitate hydratase